MSSTALPREQLLNKMRVVTPQLIRCIKNASASRFIVTSSIVLPSMRTGRSSFSNDSWSQTLSFASPESDFSGAAGPTMFKQETVKERTAGINVAEGKNSKSHWNTAWSQTLSFASPESDFSVAQDNVLQPQVPLPRTMREAMDHAYDGTALVITTSSRPHSIVYVNKAWEDFCGFPKKTVLHQPLGPLLNGGNTQSVAPLSLFDQMKRGNKDLVEAVFLNKTATGQSFFNEVRVGPLYLEENEAEEPLFLVGLMRQISEDQLQSDKVVYS